MTPLGLTAQERAFLESLAADAADDAAGRWAQVILAYDQGHPTREVAEQVGLSRSRTRYLKQVFLEKRLALFDSAHADQAEAEYVADDPIETPQGAIEEQTTGPAAQPAPTAAEQAVSLAELAGGGDAQAGEYVARQVKSLFDATKPIHQLPLSARRLLIAAALLHRLKGKPKSSQSLILSRPIEGLSADEQQLVAALVRHQVQRRAEVTYSEQALSAVSPQAAGLMLGLLRMAVALDSSHSQTTRMEIVASTQEALHLRVSGVHALTDATSAQSAAASWSQQTGQVAHIYTDADLDLDSVRQTAASLKDPGLHPDDSMAEAGRKVLRYHFFQMLVHEPGTRLGEDIEELHDMRVATRRMRAAFEVFGSYFQQKRLKALMKGLRATGRALGRVRDLDVFIEKAHRYQSSQNPDQADLAPLLKIWDAERVADRQQMLSYLDSDKYRKFVYEMNEFVNSPGEGALAFDPNDPQPNRVREVAPMLIYTRLAEVRAYDQLLTNASFEQLHALRIDFKYLRYTVEFFREVLGPESKAVIDMIKYVQDHLGDLNDANVACHLLQAFLDDWETRQLTTPLTDRENPQTIVQYLAYQANERHRLLVGFPDVWRAFNQVSFLRDLALAVAVL